jgi:hypothetical protein
MLSSMKNSIAQVELSSMVFLGQYKEDSMSTPPQPYRSGTAQVVLMTLGSVFMLLAVIFSIIFYIWGQNAPSYGENWNDVIATIFIVYLGVPFFVIGLILFVIGLVLRVRRKGA